MAGPVRIGKSTIMIRIRSNFIRSPFVNVDSPEHSFFANGLFNFTDLKLDPAKKILL